MVSDMNNCRYSLRVKEDFVLRGIKREKQYFKGQWIKGDLRMIDGRRMVIADGFFLDPNKFDRLEMSDGLS